MIPQIKHIVVLMMENHSYDNHLGMLRRAGADGFTLGSDGKPVETNPYADGRTQHAFRMPTTCQTLGHPSQSWDACHIQRANGRLDGFVISGSGPVAMGYWQRDDLPFYYSLASVFPIADRYFCSLLGPTFPNRRYLMAATSIGMINDTVPSPTAYPQNGTIFDRLHDAGVPWKDYFSVTSIASQLALFPPLLVKYAGNLRSVNEFYEDAQAGTLPGLSLVEPNYGIYSEESPQNIALGERFAAKVINAVMSGPAWESTLLIWCYDEHGGYYDHVPPPPATEPDHVLPHSLRGGIGPLRWLAKHTGLWPRLRALDSRDGRYDRYGFRVPAVVVCPYAKADYASSTPFDHTSALKLIEEKWNLPPLTRRDASATAPWDLIDLSAVPPFLNPPVLPAPTIPWHHYAAHNS